MKRLCCRLNFWLSGRVKSKRQPSNSSGLRVTAFARRSTTQRPSHNKDVFQPVYKIITRNTASIIAVEAEDFDNSFDPYLLKTGYTAKVDSEHASNPSCIRGRQDGE
eukprot:80548-Pyramimonas_sp.AAC.1